MAKRKVKYSVDTVKVKEGNGKWNFLIIFDKDPIVSILNMAKEAVGNSTLICISNFRNVDTEARLRTFMSDLLNMDIDRVLTVGDFVSKKLLGKRFDKMQAAHGALYQISNTGMVMVPTLDKINYHSNIYRKRDIYRWVNLGYQDLKEGSDYVFIKDIPVTTKGDIVFIDIETASANSEEKNGALDVMSNLITSFQIAYDNGPVYFIQNPTLDQLKAIYEGLSGKTVVVHNAMFDIATLSRYTQLPWYNLKLYDTMLAAKSRGGETVNLKHLSTMLTDTSNPLAYQTAHHSFDTVYAVADVIATREVYKWFMSKGTSPIDDLNNCALGACIKARIEGIRIDQTILKQQLRETSNRLQELSNEIFNLAKVAPNTYNIANREDKKNLLLKCGVPLNEKTAKGNSLSVSKTVLQSFAGKYEVVDKLLEYQQYETYISHFLNPYLSKETTFVHPTIYIQGASTGRTANRDPNIQQMPGDMKSCLVSRFTGGWVLYTDLDGAEMRVAALLSGDKTFAKSLLEYDVHSLVASIAFKKPYAELIKNKDNPYRKIAKTVGFGLMYGATEFGLSHTANVPVGDIRKVIDAFFTKFPKLMAFLENEAHNAVKRGMGVDHYGGIRSYRYLKALGKFKDIKRRGKNTPIQALSAYTCLELFCYIHQQIEDQGLKSVLVMQIHDSIYIDTHPTEIEQVSNICQTAFKNLNNTHLSTVQGWGNVPIEGDLTKSHSFETKKAEFIRKLSSQE